MLILIQKPENTILKDTPKDLKETLDHVIALK